jgi:flagellar hook-associated protein 2
MATTTTSIPTSSPIYTQVNSLLALMRQPITALQSKRQSLTNLDAVYTDVRANLKSLNDSVAALKESAAALATARTASLSDGSVLAAAAGSGAALGNHTISVSQLARQHTLAGDQLAQGGAALRTALGAGDQSFTVTVAGVSTVVTVNIGPSDTDAAVIAATAAAINSALSGAEHAVTASAVNDSASTARLTLRSADSGLANKISLADSGGSLLSALGVLDTGRAATDSTGGYIYADAQLDAKLRVDGIAITRASNTLTDVLEGVTLTLRAAQSEGAAPVLLTVSSDAAPLRAKAEAFLRSLNSSVSYLSAKTAIDRATGTRQVLASQSSYRGLFTELKALGAATVDTGVAGIRSMADVGITQDSAGVFSLSDTAKFAAAAADHPAAVAALLGGEAGLSATVAAKLTPFLAAGGILDNDNAGVDGKVATVNESIKRLEASVALRQEQLIAKYSNLQKVIEQTKGQTSFFNMIFGITGQTS